MHLPDHEWNEVIYRVGIFVVAIALSLLHVFRLNCVTLQNDSHTNSKATKSGSFEMLLLCFHCTSGIILTKNMS